jgi:hypothetical protein
MATTTLMPLDPALSPQQVNRILTITADLLPEEVVAARRARRTRGWVLAVVGVVILALGGWYLVAEHGTNEANADLEAVTTQQTRLQRQQAAFADVVNVQADTQTIAKQLTTLLGNDLQWADLIRIVRDTGSDAGVKVEGIAAALNATTAQGGASAATSAAGTLPTTSGAKTIGMITITGTAPDKPSVAKYVDSLGTLTTVANPFVSSVSAKSSTRAVQFQLSVDITDKALCGRFTTKCKTTGGN